MPPKHIKSYPIFSMPSTTPVNFILGTHMIGDGLKDPGHVRFDDLKDVNSLLDTFYSRGYRHLDTASAYSPDAPGTSEERLGQVQAASRFIIHTKVHSGAGDHEPSKIDSSIQLSLKSLKTPSVETMFLHMPDRQTPFEDTAKAMNDAIKQGKVEKFGLSNYPATEVQKFIDICEENGYAKPSVYQGHYNAIVRGGEKELFPLLRKHNIAFFAYSPAAAGLFSGNKDNSTRWSDENMVGRLYNSIYGKAPVQDSIAIVLAATKKFGINGHAASVRWTAFHSVLDAKYGDGVVFGVSSIEQLNKTLDALEAGPLPAELADSITAIYVAVEGSEPPYYF